MGCSKAPVTPELPGASPVAGPPPRGAAVGGTFPDPQTTLPHSVSTSNRGGEWGGRENNYFSASNLSGK